jgi:hypothetical protein
MSTLLSNTGDAITDEKKSPVRTNAKYDSNDEFRIEA